MTSVGRLKNKLLLCFLSPTLLERKTNALVPGKGKTLQWDKSCFILTVCCHIPIRFSNVEDL